jgi:1-acyl-sn-glycerol-3-phosphate acyltransferase
MTLSERQIPLDEAGFDRSLKGAVRVFLFLLFVFSYSLFYVFARFVFRGNPYLLPRVLYRGTLAIFGMKVRVHGQIAQTASTLFMANHSSYLDVPVLGAYLPAFFVAKADVAHWPIFGPLTRLYRTVFVERNASRAAVQRDNIRPMLEKGYNLVIFPEGTSTDGQRTLPFKSSLFSLAEGEIPGGGFVTVQPVSVVCTRLGGVPIGRSGRPAYAWFGDMDFIPHFWKAIQLGGFTVDVILHKPLTVETCGDRKKLAAATGKAVAEGVELLLTGRPVGG